MIKGYQTELMDMYEKIRTDENRKLMKRREEIKNKYPEILELDTTIQKLCLNLSMAALRGITDQNELNNIKEEITDLRAKKYEMLVSHGYNPDYLNLHYNCPKCKDTGFIGIDKCSCFKSKLIKLYYKDSDLEEAVKTNNFKNFNINTLKDKVENKLRFQEELALEVNENIPMIGMVTRLTHQKGIDLVLHVADEILKTGAQLVILGTGDSHYEDALRALEYRRHDKVRSLIMFSSAMSSKVYSSCDMFLMPSKTEPCGLSQLISMRYATVPIVHRVGGLRDTVEPFDGKYGTGFTFESFDAYDMLDAVYRATYCYYQERHNWNKIMKNTMKQDVSWKKSALKYINMYNEIV